MPTYYIDGLHRQASAPYARQYLGIENANGENLLTNFGSARVDLGYIVQSVPTWNDERTPLAALRANPAASPDWDPFIGNLYAWRWDRGGGLDKRLDFELQIPHGINTDPTYGFRMHLHWSCGMAAASAAVGWYLEASIAALGTVFPAPTLYGPFNGTPTIANQHIATGLYTFTGFTDSAVILGSIYRDRTDDYTGNDVFGLSLDGHYVVQQLGSLEPF